MNIKSRVPFTYMVIFEKKEKEEKQNEKGRGEETDEKMLI